MTDALTELLEPCYTGVVHDVMRAMGMKNFTLPQNLRPILPEEGNRVRRSSSKRSRASGSSETIVTVPSPGTT